MRDWWKQAKGRAKLCYRASQPQAFQISSDITYKLMLLATHATPSLSNSHVSFNSQRSSKEGRGAELCLLSLSRFASSLHRAGLEMQIGGSPSVLWRLLTKGRIASCLGHKLGQISLLLHEIIMEKTHNCGAWNRSIHIVYGYLYASKSVTSK